MDKKDMEKVILIFFFSVSVGILVFALGNSIYEDYQESRVGSMIQTKEQGCKKMFIVLDERYNYSLTQNISWEKTKELVEICKNGSIQDVEKKEVPKEIRNKMIRKATNNGSLKTMEY